MQHVSKTAQLNAAWNGVFELQLPWGRLAPQMAMSDWVNSQNIHAWTIKSDSNRCIGFTRSGNLAIRYRIRSQHPETARIYKVPGPCYQPRTRSAYRFARRRPSSR
jgi:hypothetical protein